MIDKCAKKFGINGQLRDKLLLIVMHHFLLVKAAMNEPHIFKMCNGVNQTPQCLNFSTAKGGTKAIAHFSIAERLSFRSFDSNYDCKLRNDRKYFI